MGWCGSSGAPSLAGGAGPGRRGAGRGPGGEGLDLGGLGPLSESRASAGAARAARRGRGLAVPADRVRRRLCKEDTCCAYCQWRAAEGAGIAPRRREWWVPATRARRFPKAAAGGKYFMPRSGAAMRRAGGSPRVQPGAARPRCKSGAPGGRAARRGRRLRSGSPGWLQTLPVIESVPTGSRSRQGAWDVGYFWPCIPWAGSQTRWRPCCIRCGRSFVTGRLSS